MGKPDQDYTGVSTARLREVLSNLCPYPGHDAVCEWLKARGVDSKDVSRLMVEPYPFTGIALVDRCARDADLELFPLLEIVASRQRGAAKKMATDILWLEYMDRNDLPLTPEAIKEANAQVKYALTTNAGREWLEFKVAEIEERREEVLGPLTEEELAKREKLRQNAIGNLNQRKDGRKYELRS